MASVGNKVKVAFSKAYIFYDWERKRERERERERERARKDRERERKKKTETERARKRKERCTGRCCRRHFLLHPLSELSALPQELMKLQLRHLAWRL
jgi:hypothetical protein